MDECFDDLDLEELLARVADRLKPDDLRKLRALARLAELNAKPTTAEETASAVARVRYEFPDLVKEPPA